MCLCNVYTGQWLSFTTCTHFRCCNIDFSLYSRSSNYEYDTTEYDGAEVVNNATKSRSTAMSEQTSPRGTLPKVCFSLFTINLHSPGYTGFWVLNKTSPTLVEVFSVTFC